ncbi:hypothetical protein BURPS406E_B0867 [Burkholderia pseudomallei 406e]|nr:hypothetical protein BPC006_I0565 [Burkholderia pseudomallei BPC006]EDK54670.1 hypothetical protein BMAFMH_B0592 [Burkholderia mallei FMH]EDO82897.1 hypothetical protein BURPS406E_B0867 [Burkholderia pseudomallei 406e]
MGAAIARVCVVRRRTAGAPFRTRSVHCSNRAPAKCRRIGGANRRGARRVTLSAVAAAFGAGGFSPVGFAASAACRARTPARRSTIETMKDTDEAI